MTHGPDLRERFAELRRLEEAETPSFETIRRRSRRGPARSLMSWAAAASLATAWFVVLLLAPDHRSHVTISTPMLAEWRSPTAFLLDTPGRDLLRTIPEFGVYPAAELILQVPTHTIAPANAGQGQS